MGVWDRHLKFWLNDSLERQAKGGASMMACDGLNPSSGSKCKPVNDGLAIDGGPIPLLSTECKARVLVTIPVRE